MDNLPEAVRRAAEEADRIQAALAGEGQTATTDVEPAPEPTAQPAGGTAQPAPAPTAEPAPAPSADVWRQRYETLQAKYNAEVPRLIDQNRQVVSRLTELEAQLAAAAKPASKPATLPVTDEDKEAFGADLMAAVDRVASARMAEVQALLDEVRAENAHLKQQLSGVQGATEQEKFYAALYRQLPDWEAINFDPKFKEWLQHKEEFTGLTRDEILQTHVSNWAADMVAAMMKRYKAESTPAQSPTTQSPARAAQTNPLETHVAPARGSGGGGAPNTEKNVWTSASIAKFYEDARRGKYPSDQAARLEADLMRAVAAGEVVS